MQQGKPPEFTGSSSHVIHTTISRACAFEELTLVPIVIRRNVVLYRYERLQAMYRRVNRRPVGTRGRPGAH